MAELGEKQGVEEFPEPIRAPEIKPLPVREPVLVPVRR